MTTITAERSLLADAARVLATHRALDPLLDRLASAPFDPCVVDELRTWLDVSYPYAAAALDRVQASGATAPPPRRRQRHEPSAMRRRTVDLDG